MATLIRIALVVFALAPWVGLIREVCRRAPKH